MSDAIWIELEDGRIMTIQGAEPDFYTEGCDASIDYTLFDQFCEEYVRYKHLHLCYQA